MNRTTPFIFFFLFIFIFIGSAFALCVDDPGATNCGSLTGGQCSSTTTTPQYGCKWEFTCDGSALNCLLGQFQGSQSTCESQEGCMWSHCGNTATACGTFNNESGCDEQDGCNWGGDCIGTPNSCSSYPGDQCESHSGCKTEGCKGQTSNYHEACAEYNKTECTTHIGAPYCFWSYNCLDTGRASCSSFDSSSCESEGCDWSAGCNGTATSCSTYPSSLNCNSQDGCGWQGSYDYDCSGSATSCSSFTDASACSIQEGCTSESDCTGSASSCSSFNSNETNCGKQIGCAWEEECTPSRDCSYYYNKDPSECGTGLDDGCGDFTLNCTSCPSGESCVGGECVLDSCPTLKECDYYYRNWTCGEGLEDGCGGEIDCLDPSSVLSDTCCWVELKDVRNAITCGALGEGGCGFGFGNGCFQMILDCPCPSGEACTTSAGEGLGQCIELPCQTDQDCVNEQGSGWHCTNNECEQDCSTSWTCNQDNTGRTKKNTDCSSAQTEDCPGGCSNGTCQAQTCSDGTPYGQCSSDPNSRGQKCIDGELTVQCVDTGGGFYMGNDCPCTPSVEQCGASGCEPLCLPPEEDEDTGSCGCEDGTDFVRCSTENPGKYCDEGGSLVDKCSVCNCSQGFHCGSGEVCEQDCDETRECNAEGNITITNSNCEPDTINCDYGCTSDYCDCEDGTAHGETNSSGQTCNNGTLSDPEEPTETCSINTWECNGSARQQKNADCSWNIASKEECTNSCFNGSCKCSDGTNSGACSDDEPLKCENGFLEIDCGCCPNNEHCNEDDECVPDCDEEWVCIESNSKVAHRLENCSYTDKSSCSDGCANGVCIGETCSPKTCNELSWECGSGEQCGNQITCGECSESSECVNNKCEKKEDTQICSIKGWECGTGSADSYSVNCGSCGLNDECTESKKCETSLACSDGTPFNKCSAGKPSYCEFGVQKNRCELCGCPSGMECGENGSCNATVNTCVDGTEYGDCSAKQSIFCDSYGTLKEDCGECGCPDGKVCSSKTGKCESELFTDCGVLEHEACQPAFKPLYCFNGKTLMSCDDCGCDNSLNCNYSTGKCQRSETVRIVRVSGDGTECSRRKNCSVEFEFRDSENKLIAEKDIDSIPKIFLLGIELELVKKGNGRFSFVLKPGFKESDEIQIRATALVHLDWEFLVDQNISLLFENEAITGKIEFEKSEFRQGETIGRIKFDPMYENGEKLEEGAFTASIESDGFTIEKKLEWNNGVLECSFDYPVNEEDSVSGLLVGLNGTDNYGNRLEEKIKIPVVKGKNPVFHLELSPLSEVQAYGSSIEVEVRPVLGEETGTEKTEVMVYSNALALDKKLEFDESKGLFVAVIELPGAESGIKQVDLAFTGFSEKGVEKTNYSERKLLSLTSKLGVEFIFPREGISFSETGQVEKIIVNISASPDSSVTREEIDAVIAIDGKTKKIVLKRDPQTGMHSATMLSPIQIGEHVLSLELAGGLDGNAAIKTNIQPMLPIEIIAVLAVVLALCVSFLVFLRKSFVEKQTKSETKKKTSAEKKKDLKKLKKQFFKREISEEEYNKSALKLGAEITEIGKSIKKEKHSEKPAYLKQLDEIQKRTEEIKKKRESDGK